MVHTSCLSPPTLLWYIAFADAFCSTISSSIDASLESASPISVKVGVAQVVFTCIISSVSRGLTGKSLFSFELFGNLCTNDDFSVFWHGNSDMVLIV